MSKVYYDETLKSGERVVVTDSYVRYIKYNRKNKKSIIDKTMPLSSITKVSEKADKRVVIKIGLLAPLPFILGTIIGFFIYTIIVSDFWGIVNVKRYFFIFLSIYILSFLFNIFFKPDPIPVKGVCLMIDNKDYFYIDKRNFKGKDSKQLLEAITTAIDENKN